MSALLFLNAYTSGKLGDLTQSGCYLIISLAFPAHHEIFLTLEGHIQEKTKPPIFLCNFGKAPVSDLHPSASRHPISLAGKMFPLVMGSVSTSTLGGRHADHRASTQNQQNFLRLYNKFHPQIVKSIPHQGSSIA